MIYTLLAASLAHSVSAYYYQWNNDISKGCCRLYTDRYWGGDMLERCDGDGYSLDNFWRDNIESWECGPKTFVRFCSNSAHRVDARTGEYRCPAKFAQLAGGDSLNPSMRMMNLIRAVQVFEMEEQLPLFYTLFSRDDCSGFSWAVLGFRSELDDDEYLPRGMHRFGSIIVPEGFEVVLYDEDGNATEIPRSRRDDYNGCTAITDEQGNYIDFKEIEVRDPNNAFNFPF